MTAYSITTDPTLQARVCSISRRDEDRAQNMYLHLLEQERHNPKFAQRRGLGYYVRAAKFAAQHDIERTVIYNKYVECESFLTDDDGTEVSVFDTLIADDELLPEEQVEQGEAQQALCQAIAALPANQRQIANLLLHGYSAAEVAKKLGTSKANVSQITARARQTLGLEINGGGPR